MEADNLPEIGEDEDFEDEDALGPPNFFSFTYAEFKEFFGTSDQVEVKVFDYDKFEAVFTGLKNRIMGGPQIGRASCRERV